MGCQGLKRFNWGYLLLTSTFNLQHTMKNCAYCGKENDDDAIHCRACGTDGFKALASADKPAELVAPDLDLAPTKLEFSRTTRPAFCTRTKTI